MKAPGAFLHRFVLYLEAVSYSVNPCISRVVKVWCRVSRRQTLHFIWCKILVSRFATSRSALHGNLFNDGAKVQQNL